MRLGGLRAAAAKSRDGASVAALALAALDSEAFSISALGLFVTPAEVALSLAIASAAAVVLCDRRLALGVGPSARTLGWALGFGAVAALLAAATADANRDVALRGGLRLLAGAAFTACCLQGGAALLRRLSAVAVGLVVATAGLGAFEQLAGDGWFGPAGAELEAALLEPFRPKASITDDGARRLTATFAHANLAAAWLAVLAPLGLSSLAATPSATVRPWRRLAAPAFVAIATLALALTLSRAGLVAGCAGMAVALFAMAPGQARRDLASARVLGLVLAAAAPSVRARVSDAGPALAATIEATPMSGSAGGAVAVRLRNTGWLTWRPAGADRHRLIAVPLSCDGAVPAQPGGVGPVQALDVPHRVAPGAEVSILLAAAAAPAAAAFALDVEHHGHRSACHSGGPITLARRADIACAVSAPPCGSSAWHDASTVERAGAPHGSTDRRELWAAALAAARHHPWFGLGPDVFRLRKAEFLPPRAIRRDDREHANNLALEVVADLGLCGAMAMLAIVAALWSAVRQLLGRQDLEGAALVLGGAGGVVALGFHGLADAPLFSWAALLASGGALAALACGADAAAAGDRASLHESADVVVPP